jgi:Met-zincin/Domain of unknown function (DUF5117)/Domain of unknown function (DUF5118)
MSRHIFRLGQRLMALLKALSSARFVWRMGFTFSLGLLLTLMPTFVPWLMTHNASQLQAVVNPEAPIGLESHVESNSLEGIGSEGDEVSTIVAKSTSKTPAKNTTQPRKPAIPKPSSNNAIQKKSDDSSSKPGAKVPSNPLDPGQPPKISDVVKKFKKIEGLFTLYRSEKDGKLLMEVSPEQLNRNYLSIMTLESGLGQRGLYSGLPVGEFLFNLRRVNDTIQFVIPNTFIRSDPGSPISRSTAKSFSDSPLEALKIIANSDDKKNVLVELTPLFLADLPGLKPLISAVLEAPYAIDPKRTYLGTIKNFPQNVELESVYGYAGMGDEGSIPSFLSTLPDSRAFELRVRYSLSALPEKNGYRPRMADDRIGYFLTAFQNFGTSIPQQPFIRYINRWHLEKADPNANLSPPIKPITFWLENTIPLEYRDAVREGILMWNTAYEKIGFKNAIEVKQMPDNADWDPADSRYNTIRWFTSTDAFFAMGPSRTNPLTGEILDADVIIDANFVRSLKQEFRNVIETNQARNLPLVRAIAGEDALCQEEVAIGKDFKKITQKSIPKPRFSSHALNLQDICRGMFSMQQFSTGQMSLSLLQNALPSDAAMKDYINDFLRELLAHEVGHTLGLRHNFHGSTMLKTDELNNTQITRQRGLVSSVMDYNAVNLAPQGVKQGDYYTRKVGPYDEWAIAYGYAIPTTQNPAQEREMLSKIAGRAPEKDLAFATDEDRSSGLDPEVVAFDMSGDLLNYSQAQFDNARAMWGRLDQRLPLQGESFNDVRVAFDSIFGYYFGYTRSLSNYIGGQYINRYRGGDAAGRFPFEAVSLADQRKALDLIRRNVFDEKAFQFSPELLNKLASSRWNHWGMMPSRSNLDYPVLDRFLFLQTITMVRLTNYDRLARMREGELKNPAQTLTIPELMDTMQSSIWSEVLNAQDGFKLAPMRRGLQRQHMNLLVAIALRQYDVPDDAQTVVRYEMRQLKEALTRAMKKADPKDPYTVAHLEETRDRLAKAIDAPLVGN